MLRLNRMLRDKPEKPKIAPINARSEDAFARPMFRQAIQKRRCLVPADGNSEWRSRPGELKQPFEQLEEFTEP